MATAHERQVKHIRNYRATTAQRLMSELHFMRFWIPDLIAALCTIGLIVLLPIIAAAF